MWCARTCVRVQCVSACACLCVRYTHTYAHAHARARVCVRACLRVCAGVCVGHCGYTEYYTRMRICDPSVTQGDTSVGENVRFSICKHATVCAALSIMHK